jgi:hypothetical protein
MKTCRTCGENKELACFPKEPNSPSGVRNECKDCRNEVSKRRYEANRSEVLSSQMQVRRADPERDRLKKRRYRATERGIEKAASFRKIYKKAFPERITARRKVIDALLSGSLRKMPCLVCGDAEVDGHHPDYSSPLDVVWLCRLHHAQTHKLAADIDRGLI